MGLHSMVGPGEEEEVVYSITGFRSIDAKLGGMLRKDPRRLEYYLQVYEQGF